MHGFYFGGNCGGCMLFTTWPMIWASGGTVLNDDGTQSTVNNPQAAQVYGLYKQMYAEGSSPRTSKNEPGATWTAPFSSGKVGIQPEGATDPRHHQGEHGPAGRRRADPRPGRRRVVVRRR